MSKTILNYVKNVLGLCDEDNSFDLDLCMWANAAFATLRQLKVGPIEGFAIPLDAPTPTWEDYHCEFSQKEMVKAYVVLYCRKNFDPPTSGFVMDAIENQLREYEFRLNIETDGGID